MTFHKYIADSKMFEYDKHYRECQQQNKPFIKSKINPVHGNYTVTIDLMTCNYVFSELETFFNSYYFLFINQVIF